MLVRFKWPGEVHFTPDGYETLVKRVPDENFMMLEGKAARGDSLKARALA